MEKLSIIILFLLIFVLVSCDKIEQEQVCFKDNCFDVELAITPYERNNGLMFRKNMDLDKGMFFVFEDEKEHSFWMKNTLIPLDIIWINKNKDVVFINKNTPICKPDKCPLISPGKGASYVLELNAGSSDRIGLEIGNKLVFDI